MKAWISSFVLMMGMAAALNAKPISRIIAEMGLTPEDFALVSAASDAMLASGTPQVGTESTWTSEVSGAKGTIRIVDMRDNCAILQHQVQAGGSDQIRDVRTQRCRDASGKWVLTP